MTSELYNPTQQVTTDEFGAFEWKAPPPTGSGLYVQVAVSVLGGEGGTFQARVSGMPWGEWSGSSPFGPITYQGSLTLTITGVGLNPNTAYLVQLSGIVDEIDELLASIPTALGATALFGSRSFIDVSNITQPCGEIFQYEWFPCTRWGAMRLAAKVEVGGPMTVQCDWFNESRTRGMGSRSYNLGSAGGPGTKLEVVVPHLGDVLRITIETDQCPT